MPMVFTAMVEIGFEKGIPVRLGGKKKVWKTDETPAHSLDIRNNGKEPIDFVRVAEAHCQIELDGRWYGWAALADRG